MIKAIAILLASILFAAGVPAMHGMASAVVSRTGTMPPGDVDIWQFQCTSGQTSCMVAQVCDGVASSADTWEVTLDVYAPTTLLGKGATQTAGTGLCSLLAEVCRVPPSHGAMKAFVNINHPAGATNTDTYILNGECRDVDGNVLPDSTTKFIIKTNE